MVARPSSVVARATNPFLLLAHGGCHDFELMDPKGAMGVFSFVLIFALVWHMWAIATVGLLGIVGTFIARTDDGITNYCAPAAEVARTERERHALPAKAA